MGTKRRHTDRLTGTRLAGRYELSARLGSGGMGVVYEALDTTTDELVAVKCLHQTPDARRKDVERLRMEARAVQEIDHRNVVKFLDYGQDESGRPYLVMERLRGQSLSKLLKSLDGPLPCERAVSIVLKTAEGVAAAHEKGLIHRDIKPGNVWLDDSPDEDAGDRVRVLDFGLVRPLRGAANITVTGVLLGTPYYLAPELIEHPPRVTPACDVYALGVLLYQVVVGHRPFRGDSFFGIVDAQLHAKIPKPRCTDAGESIPPAIRRVWTRALSKDPNRRYPDAGAFRAALYAAVCDDGKESVATRPLEDGPRVAQRKLVTVLTVNLLDPMKTDPRLLDDDANAKKLLKRFVKSTRNHGGAPYGDPSHGYHALFGLPTPRRNDAVQALQCALDCWTDVQDYGRGLLAEIGLHTRYVMAAAPSSTEAMTPVEAPWELAEALGRHARERGGVAVSGTTYRTLWRHLRDPVPVGMHVGGESVHFLPAGVVLETNRAPSEQWELAGRQPVFERLQTWVQEALTGRQAQLKLLSGGVGMGKTVICAEFSRQLCALHPGVQVLDARLDPASDAPFNVFERLLGSAVSSSSRERAGRLVQWVADAVSLHGDAVAREDARLMLRLVGLTPLGEATSQVPQGERARAFQAFSNVFSAVAAQGGLVLLVDDFHYADEGSLTLLDYLIRELSTFPVCVIGFSTEGAAVLSRYPSSIRLRPLSLRASTQMVRQLCADAPMKSDAVKRLVRRAGGNPLFLEELVRAAQEGVADPMAHLPDSVRALVTSRIEALTASLRRVLHAASVAGRAFWTGSVGCQLGSDGDLQSVQKRLAILADRGLIERTGNEIGGDAGEEEWTFPSQLVQETVYQLMLRSARAKGHRAVAEWLTARLEVVGVAAMPWIAAHWQRAREQGRAAEAWVAAAEAARARFANGDARTFYEKALALEHGWGPERLIPVQLALGVVLHQLGHRQRSESLLKRVAEDPVASKTAVTCALRYLARTAAWAGDLERQRKLLERAVRVAPEAALEERLFVASDLAYALIRAGDTVRAEQILDAALSQAYQAESLGAILLPLAQLHQTVAVLHRSGGDLVGAEREGNAAIDLYTQLGHTVGMAATLTSLSVCLRDMEQYERAGQAASKAAELFHQWGYAIHELTALINLAWTRVESGNPQTARHLLMRLQPEFDHVMTVRERVLVRAGLGLVEKALGQQAAAKKHAMACVELIDGVDILEVRGWALHAAGCVLGNAEQLEEAVASWRSLKRPAWLLRSLEGLAGLTSAQDAKSLRAEAAKIRKRLKIGARGRSARA